MPKLALFENARFQRAARLCGVSPETLFGHVARLEDGILAECPTGDLSAYPDWKIEACSHWAGAPGALVGAYRASGLLYVPDGADGRQHWRGWPGNADHGIKARWRAKRLRASASAVSAQHAENGVAHACATVAHGPRLQSGNGVINENSGFGTPRATGTENQQQRNINFPESLIAREGKGPETADGMPDWIPTDLRRSALELGEVTSHGDRHWYKLPWTWRIKGLAKTVGIGDDFSDVLAAVFQRDTRHRREIVLALVLAWAKRNRIKNAGGWVRTHLRRAGVELRNYV